MKKDTLENRQIRIFLSSTFRDMQAERGYLVTRVFPALRRYCEERDVSIFELDLRWGISEEEAKQGKVFDICLKEVRKTQPFFIGLLGERYGWAPTEDERKSMARNTTVFEDFPWVADELAKGTSITEIEFQEGALRSTEKIEAYFYLRSPRMETPAEFRETEDSHEGKKLRELKNTLREQNVYPVKEYDSIEQLGALVEKDFKSLVDELFPEGALSPLEKERHEQHIFLVNKTKVYVPNPAWDAKLDEFADSTESAIVISGESGMGKSALIANWVSKRLQKKNENEKIIYHFIRASRSEGDSRKISQRLIDEIRDIYGIPAKEEGVRQIAADSETENQTDKQTEELQNLLFSIAGNEKLIIALDGVDRLDDADAKLLNWLPPSPQNVKYIFSATPGDTSMEAFTRRGYQRLDIGALPVELIQRLVNDYLKFFSKSLTPAQVERIAADKESGNPLALLAVLDELRVSGVHEKLDNQIDEFLAAPDVESLFALVLQHTEELFSGGNVRTLSGSVSKNLVQDILSLILVSRQGLSETEILELSGAAPLYWSQLANSMAGHLSAINGLVTFSNRLMQNAAKKRYLPNAASEQPYHDRIVSYMETNEHVSFERKCDELPSQFFLREWDKLYSFLLNHKVFLYISKKNRFEIGVYWQYLREQDGGTYTPEKYLELDNTVEDKDTLLEFYESAGLMIKNYLGDYSLSLKFVLRCKEICEEMHGENHLHTAMSHNAIGFCYEALGEYQKALEYHHKSLAIKVKLLGINHTDTALSYINIGSCYDGLGEYQKALEYYHKCLTIWENLMGINHPETAIGYDNIGTCYIHLGEYQKALEYCHKSLAIREKLLGETNSDTVRSYNNIGACYSHLGDYRKALDYYYKSLAIRKKLFGINHPSTALSYNNIGLCYSDLGEYQKALEYHQKSLDINEKLLGRNHPDTATSYNNIGLCYNELGDKRKALEYYLESLAIHEKLLGIDHPTTAVIYDNIGSCYGALGDNQKALEYHHKSLDIRKKLLGKNHPDTAVSYNNIGLCYNNLGDNQKALEYYLESLAINEKLLGTDHLHTAGSYINIGSCYRGLGDNQKALEYYHKSRAVYEKLLGINHLHTAKSYNNIGLCYNNLGDNQKALEYYHKSIEIDEKLLGKNHLSTVASYHNIGLCYSDLGDNQKALEYHLKCLAIRENQLGINHLQTIESFYTIGTCYKSLGDYRQALEYYHKSLALSEKFLGESHPATVMSCNGIGECYRSLGDNQKALEYHHKCLVLREKLLGHDHPDTAASYHFISVCYENLGDYHKALEYYHVLECLYEKFAGEHPGTAAIYNSIGVCYSSLGDNQKALEYLNKGLVIREKLLGMNHPDTATSYNNMGYMYYISGDYQKALGFHLEALEMRKKIFGETHQNTAFSYNKAAMDYEALGDNKKAVEYYTQALSIYSSLKGMETKAEDVRRSIEKLDTFIIHGV
jgi:tetratricopeptide (TPR) repeat protein